VYVYTENVDFTAGLYPVIFHAERRNAVTNVSITDDNIIEGNETFSVNIVQASFPKNIRIASGTPATARVTILDTTSKLKLKSEDLIYIL